MKSSTLPQCFFPAKAALGTDKLEVIADGACFGGEEFLACVLEALNLGLPNLLHGARSTG